ncbi:dephospho-CoA kinase [Ruminococcus sp.]|uniref:dephospho-CoA kinase n=1 Tax=Ruminococcus sp. TaxID=41978 RepID=UPI0025E80FCA|nr:dephospho-CoA kinase [Ruminococcus sp.]MBQ8965264.1 dephospho-CoA kinase [Ruminococcus sp.]
MSRIVGLTGQSGAGKTLVSAIFEREGFGIINCDYVAREVTEAGSECNKELAMHFPTCFDEELILDRQALGQIVFSDREKLDLLNSIIFRYICELIDKKIEELGLSYEYILLDAPTLFEAGADSKCDVIVAVTADENIRLGRITERDSISSEQALKRFASQHSSEFFKTNSDYVINNEGTREDTEKQVMIVINKIKDDKIGGSKR